MPSNANAKSSTEKGSSYSPEYDVWNDQSGAPIHRDNGEGYAGSGDNGSGYTSGGENGGGFLGRGIEQPDGGKSSRDSAVDSLRQAENGALSAKEPSYYTGNGRGGDNGAGGKKAKGKKKGLGALVTILLMIVGGGAFLGSSNSLLAPALSSLLTSSSQTTYTSYVLRTKYITKSMISGAGGAVTTGWTGAKKYSKIPNYLKTRLASNNIEVIGSGSSTKLRWEGQDIDADQFVNMFNSNVEFRDSYMKAKRGRVATFFDKVADKFYSKLGLSRNWRVNLKDTGNAEVDAKNLDDLMSSKFEPTGKTNVRTNTKYTEERITYEQQLNETTGKMESVPVKEYIDHEPTTSATSGKEGVDMDTAKSSASSFLTTVAGTISSIGSAACSLMKIGNMIAITVAANEIYQSITFANGNMEGPSKMMAGYGSESGINSQLNKASTAVTASVTDFNNLNISMTEGANNYSDGNTPQSTITAAPIEAPLLLTMLAGAPASTADANNYSLERTIKAMGGATLFTKGNAMVCASADIVNSVISISSTFAAGVPSFVGSFIVKAGIAVATQVAMKAALGFLIPTIARSLFTNTYDTAVGVIFGNLLAQGMYAGGSHNGLAGGQSLSDKESAGVFNHATNTVLALEAEQDRLNHSPFDITNGNTFFGSIAYSLIPTITSTKFTSIASFLRSTSKSLSTLMSGVSAEGENSSYMTTYGDCPLLDEINAVGDLFCNPIITTDMSTIEMSPTDSSYTSALDKDENGTKIFDSCDGDGNCDINGKSNLARYISYCDNRDSPFGVVDQNILGAMQDENLNNVILTSIPLVSDFIDIINNATDLKNMDWATGAKCVNTADNSFWNSEGKYYQRYVEDQRILDQMGAYEGGKNPVMAYEEKYEAAHPTDDSYIGYLSRISGLTPENTEIVVAYAVYQNFVDQYDPTNRIAMNGTTSDILNGEEASAEIASSMINFADDDSIYNPLETNSTKHEHIIYFDLRNRSYVA